VQIELTKDYVIFQAQGKLLELSVEIAESRSLPKVKDQLDLATKIRIWLRALAYSDYLEKEAIDRLVYTLADLCEANAVPYVPIVTSVSPPSILVGIPGARGDQGEQGDEGGGVPFAYADIASDTIVDSFPITDSRGVEYTINIFGASGQRIMRLLGGWSEDGTDYGDDGGDGSDDIYGDTSPVSMSVVVTGSTVQLFAAITSGTWTINGTRNNGNGIVTPSTLANGKILVGNASNVPTAVTVSGDFTISNAGVGALSAGVIVNADVNASAAIATTKLAAQTASRAAVYDASGFLTVSGATATQVGYLSNVTSDIQTQLDSKLSAATGAISTVVSTDLTTNRALIANGLGKIAVSSVTSTELGYLSGVTSALQTQLNNKLSLSGGTMTGNIAGASGVNIVLQGTGAFHAASGSFMGSTNGNGGFPGGISTQNPYPPYWKVKIVEIGDWNMVSSSGINVTHGIADFKKIRSVSAVIRDDSDTTYYHIDGFSPAFGTISGGIGTISSTTINLGRTNAGTFNSIAFDSTSFNRGWVTILYES
jgi:hypothetical protein